MNIRKYVACFKIRKKEEKKNQVKLVWLWEMRREKAIPARAVALVNERGSRQPSALSQKNSKQASVLVKRIPPSHINSIKTKQNKPFPYCQNSHCKKSTCKPGFKRLIDIQPVTVKEPCNLGRYPFCNVNMYCFKRKQIMLINGQFYVTSLYFTRDNKI